jgi:hypothetical protein
MHPTVHRDIVKAYLDERLTASEFERLYLIIFREGTGFVIELLYDILNEIFWAVEDYQEDVTPEEEVKDKFSITEATMRKRVATAYQKLEKFLNEYEGSYYQDPPPDINTLKQSFIAKNGLAGAAQP